MLLDIERVTEQMPVLDFFKGERDVSQVIDTLEAEWKGFSYDVHDVDTFIYGVGVKGADKNEIVFCESNGRSLRCYQRGVCNFGKTFAFI